MGLAGTKTCSCNGFHPLPTHLNRCQHDDCCDVRRRETTLMQSLRVAFLGDICGWRASLLLPVGAALAVPDGAPPSTGAGSTGTDVDVAPLLPPAAGAFGVGAEAPPLPPDGAEGVAALTGLPPAPPPPPLGWGVVAVDWGAATGAGVVGDRPPVVCWDDGARGPTVFVVPATSGQISTNKLQTGACSCAADELVTDGQRPYGC